MMYHTCNRSVTEGLTHNHLWVGLSTKSVFLPDVLEAITYAKDNHVHVIITIILIVLLIF